MRSFLSDALHWTVIITAAAILAALGTKLLFRRGKSLEEL
jgi:hypothetical protein